LSGFSVWYTPNPGRSSALVQRVISSPSLLTRIRLSRLSGVRQADEIAAHGVHPLVSSVLALRPPGQDIPALRHSTKLEPSCCAIVRSE